MERHRKLVVDELLTKPSAVSPMLFVGLGGCGCQMVARISRHLRGRPDFHERYRDLVKFALVDTNVNDLESNREIADETFLLSDFEKEQYANLASGKLFLEADPYFTQWVPPNYRFRAGDTAGAGQIRLESRLGLFYQMKHKNLVPRFQRLLEGLKSHQHGHRRLDSAEIRIIICFSVAGGTGSGCHLPLAYMLRDHAREVGKPWMIGVAVLPAVFEDKVGTNRDGIFANGYAALKELEHVMRLGAPDSRFYPDDGLVFHYDPSDESKRMVRQKPFEFVYVVDKPESFSVPEPVEAAADGLYLQFFSPLFNAQTSDYDNYTQHQRFLVPHDFEGKGILGFSTFYGSYGAAVLLVPVAGLVDYCAQSAALTLMRASFLGAIPGEPVYTTLRTEPTRFYEATLSDEDKNEKPVHVSEFSRKPPAQREMLLDRLFMKRVRLLAACEREASVEGRFMSLFRHGHRVGERPQVQGGVEYREDQVKLDQDQLNHHGMKFSIAAVVLPAVAGARPGERPGLLGQTEEAIKIHAERDRMSPGEGLRLVDLKNRAYGWVEDFQRAGMRVLLNGYKLGAVSYPGLDSLVELRFLKSEAGEVDLAAKRYAALCIRDQIRFDKALEVTGEFEVVGYKDNQLIKDKEAQTSIIEELERQAIARAMALLSRFFYERLNVFRNNLHSYAGAQRALDQGFDDLERDRWHRLERLRNEGDLSSNQYILDAEALQIEDGRRMWDFFYEDRIAELPELGLGHERVQQVLSDTVTDLSVAGGSTTAMLDRLYTALTTYAREFLQSYIGGDPHSPDRERRIGLTLVEALEQEVVYRALYRSNIPEIQKEGSKAIRRIVQEYRHQPSDQKIQLGEPRHRDYLRDKIRRVVKEKASLLCLYEESLDQQGGVRPDEVFLAAIGDAFRGTRVEEAIRGTDIPRLRWVTEEWQDPKEIIFYRAVLNVPLYTFGRMDKMKHAYEQFRRMAKRSKALHIDKNWEERLPDIDPRSAQEQHRRTLIRDQITNFASLLVIPNQRRATHGYILRREGRYMLCDPGFHGNGSAAGEGLSLLGETMAKAIERLPEVLAAERVKYFPFQQMLLGVREGLAPRVLSKIVRLPVRWRRNAEGLHDLYGSRLGPVEQEKLKDYQSAYRGLQESLEDLLNRLRNKQVEQENLGEDAGFQIAGLDPEVSRSNLAQSIQILEEFSRRWRQMEHPDQVRDGDVAPGFKGLFEPLPSGDLDEAIDELRAAFGEPGVNGHKALDNGSGSPASVPPPAGPGEAAGGQAPEA